VFVRLTVMLMTQLTKIDAWAKTSVRLIGLSPHFLKSKVLHDLSPQFLADAIFTARSTYAIAVLGIVISSVRPSVRPSVTRVLCDETKEHTADVLIPHERKLV